MDGIGKRYSIVTKKITAARHIPLGKGIEALKVVLRTIELTDKEKAILSGILEASQKKFKAFGGTDPPSITKPKRKPRKSDVDKKWKEADLSAYKGRLGLATPRPFDTVTNPRPLPGGGKKRHNKF